MSILATKLTSQAIATDVQFDDEMMQVLLNDGREVRVPLEWFPKLRDSSARKRAHWRLVGGGIGIHWPELDEDISIAALLNL